MKLDILASEYGKFGVLIDDAEDADLRLARDLYGTEQLPPWWTVARSLDCAESVLEDANRLLTEYPSTPGFFVIDRKLSQSCNATPRSTKSIDRSVQLAGLRECGVAIFGPEVESGGLRGKRQFALFITSYPHDLGKEQDRPVDGQASGVATVQEAAAELWPWQTRNLELFARSRNHLRKAKLDVLLAFGPEEPSGDMPTPHARGEYSRREWKLAMQQITEALRTETTKVVLLTGAGASMGNGFYGCGMPSTTWLLKRAAKIVAPDIPESHVGPAWEWSACMSGLADAHPEEAGPDGANPISVKNVKHLIECVEFGNPFYFSLEHLFSGRSNRDCRFLANQFLEAFRQVLHRFDYRYPYHYWLLAQLPWSRAITTNYDRYIERAVYALAETAGLNSDRQNYLELANVASRVGSSSKVEYQGGKLFKPYGTLDGPNIVLSTGDFKAYRKTMRDALTHCLRSDGPLVLVVVGQAMEDPVLRKTLIEQKLFDGDGDPGNREAVVYWVAPDAYEKCVDVNHNLPGVDNSDWCNFMRIGVTNEHQGRADITQSVPLSARALDFFFDLYAAFRQ